MYKKKCYPKLTVIATTTTATTTTIEDATNHYKTQSGIFKFNDVLQNNSKNWKTVSLAVWK
ncbi:hypothetical protein DOY81_007540 [Sarcophaga bullata]|nr:hypothetical protein DOY81_007540 [Sarcophaga bullata]